ncbi:MAG: purine-nucleoside phosphorylase [Spirochaetaceae bacterium]|nr:MAG: purine-nucleoside phosphorylase [Spirochaetaceae bacterium]
MSIHIGAREGDIAETVLLPGDPMRARFVAENFLEDARCYNEVRGMLGYTGTYKGKRVSVQGTGMGQPSISIYATELIRDYGVRNLIRVGSCGSLQTHVKLKQLVFAMSASTDSAMNRVRFGQLDYAPCADFTLFDRCVTQARERGISFTAGNVISTDAFYSEDPDVWKLWAKYGVLAAEMEAAQLYTIAAGNGARALAIMTVSDSLVDGSGITSEEREKGFGEMLTLALSLA